ncbi:MAG TPA: ABC transporter permease [Vicinamibacterales bacterium]|jgi:putative ABC transport system permease protein|nr:ABC transporter permease [Vicinamibacterales bacterium]
MWLRDLTFAARALRRSPVFALTAALTIALGIGASTAIFSVANAVLLRPLPYKDPQQLVVLYADLRARNDTGMPISSENYTDLRNGSKGAFEDMAAVTTGRQIVPAADGTPEQIRVGGVTTNFFRVMGARILLGRDFDEADGTPAPAPPPGATAPGAAQPPPLPTMAILSYEFWQRRFGGDPAIVGKDLPGAGPRLQRVVGILAPGFELLFAPADNMETSPDVWTAQRLTYNNANRNGYFLRPIGRLKAGVTLERAQAEVESAASQIRKDFPLYATSRFYERVEPMHKALVQAVRPAILALMGAVMFLLLIACANVANLLLVRASLRRAELAVRSALGAGRWRIVQQMLAEAILLTAIGATIGVGLAWAGVQELLALAPANLPRLSVISIDPTVLVFTGAISLGAAVLFGLTPAWGAFRLDLMNVLRGSSRVAGLSRGGLLRNAVVVAEVALCFVLLIGSGLMFRSFVELQRINPGYDPGNILTFQLLGGRPGPPAQRAANTRAIQDALRAIPGVQTATASFPFPLAGNFSTIRWGTEDALADNSKYQAVDWQLVRPGYFEAMRTPVIDGRTFTDADNDPSRNVVVVDQFLAAKAFPNQSAVGKRILIRVRTPEPEFVQIIGVVAHQRLTSIAEPGREEVFFTDGFLGFGAPKWALRTAGDPASFAARARAEIAKIDSSLLMTDIAPMTTLVSRAQAHTRFTLMLIGVFAAIAALLVGVGLYGVLSTVVRQRTAEIGVRMALGAAPGRILRLVVGQGLRLSVAGIIVGVVAALALTRLMTTMLVGVRASDPATFAAMTVVFLVIAAFSSWLPAWRAATVDPTIALRE